MHLWIEGCKKHFHDDIVSVSGSVNHSDEFYDKQTLVG